MNVRVAINPNHRDKMPKLSGEEMRKWWRKFNGEFVNVYIPIEKFVVAIQNGYAYTAQHIQYRKADNFLCGQHIGLDFDTGDWNSSIEYLSNVPFIRDNAAIIHTTPSHTPERPRARVIFFLPFQFRKVEKYSLITEAFAHKFGHADTSCSDPVRLFFGSSDCEVHVMHNVLDMDTVIDVVKKHLDTKKKRIAERPEKATVNGSISRIWNTMLENLATTPEGQRWNKLGSISVAAGGYVSGGYMTWQQAYDDLYNTISPMGAMPDYVARNRIAWGLEAGRQEPLYLEEDLDPILRSIL